MVENRDKIWTRDFVTVFAVNFVMSMGQFMINTLLPKYTYHLKWRRPLLVW